MPSGRLAHPRKSGFAVGSSDVTGTAQFVLLGQYARGGEEERGGGGCAQFEGEGAVGADCYARGYGGAWDEICGSCVEFLVVVVAVSVGPFALLFLLTRLLLVGGVSEGWVDGGELTLQKSMDLTPLDPRAGPTGGEGEACPAPTMSLTIWSTACCFFDMVGGICFFVWSERHKLLSLYE